MSATFLGVVGIRLFVVNSGPTKYAIVTLPDAEVVAELEGRGRILETEIEDVACMMSEDKIGPDGDGKAGGCDNILLKLIADDVIHAESRRDPD